LSGYEDARLVLQITDLHLRGSGNRRLLGVDTWDSFESVLTTALAEHTPDALLVTGDVAHDPDPEVYGRFGDFLCEAYRGPTLVLPGNHDVGVAMGDLLLDPPVLDLGPWRIIGLDSHVDDRPEARLDAEEWVRLRRHSEEAADRPVLIATHHPPLDIGCPWLDKDRIPDGRELLEWMSGQARIRAMVFGHAHQSLEFAHGEIRLLGTPSTCFQFEPGSRTFSVDDRMPGWRWLELSGNGDVHTQVRRLENYPLNLDLSTFKPA